MISGDSAKSTASSVTISASASHACPAVAGMRSGGRPSKASAAVHSNADRAITRQPKLIEALRRTPERAMDVTTELLRYPGTVKCMTRYAAEDIELHGQKIAKGDLMWIMHAGANIDARTWEDPFETNIDRPNLRDSMAFGPGLHFCVGHMLARTELTAFLTRAFQRFDIEILQEKIAMVPSYIFYGYKALQVRFTPRHA